MKTIVFAFAELEGDMMEECAGEGIAICRENDSDWREGREKLTYPISPKTSKNQKEANCQ